MIKIRKAKKGDSKQLANIFKIESSKPPYKQRWTPKKAAERIKYAIEKQNTYVILLENKIVGFSTTNINPDKREKAHIGELWIDSKYQKKGLGKQLIKHIEKMYKKKGVRELTLVSNRKANAYKFYKKLKYKENQYLVFMEKKL